MPDPPRPSGEPIEVTRLRFDPKTLVAVVVVVVSLLGAAYAQLRKTEQLEAAVTNQDRQIQRLLDESAATKQAVIELTVTLRAKGVMP